MSERGIANGSEAVTMILHREPELRDPYLLAAWSGMGNVALGAARYLKDKLGAELFGEIRLTESFRFSGILVNDDGTVKSPRSPEVPRNSLYCWRNEDFYHDLVIIIGEAQPSGMEYALARKVIEAAERLKVRRIFTSAALAIPMKIGKESRVHFVATDSQLIEDLKGHDMELMAGGSISGLNGFLLGIAKERGIEGVCLLGEMPNYLTHIEYPKASHAVLSVLTTILHIDVDLGELMVTAEYQQEEIRRYIKKIEEQLRQLKLQETLMEEMPKTLH
jgi:proteasome assembly chaperone (PAC2) family protein